MKWWKRNLTTTLAGGVALQGTGTLRAESVAAAGPEPTAGAHKAAADYTTAPPLDNRVSIASDCPEAVPGGEGESAPGMAAGQAS